MLKCCDRLARLAHSVQIAVSGELFGKSVNVPLVALFSDACCYNSNGWWIGVDFVDDAVTLADSPERRNVNQVTRPKAVELATIPTAARAIDWVNVPFAM